eukprot:c45861_g1_i1.p2 GENE.c45861_g1_i1~~c45861_g1_i1.p2  ORF type:complete len:188 (-),score=41.39 c45861_g1_i1:416-949(-)
MNSVVVAALLLVTLAAVAAASLPATASAASAAGQWQTSSSSNSTTWEKCMNITFFGDTCVILQADAANLSLSVELTVRGHVLLHETLTGNSLCVDDNTLLSLLDLICPECAPIVKEIEKVLGFLPASVLSVCLEVTNVVFTSTSVSGDSELVSTILCWEKHCVYSGTDNFGPFKINF